METITTQIVAKMVEKIIEKINENGISEICKTGVFLILTISLLGFLTANSRALLFF